MTETSSDPAWHLVPVERLFETLETSATGLTADEAARRIARFGTNELKVRADTPQYVKFLRQFRNFFALLLIVGGGLSLFAEWLDPGQGNLYIAIALFAVVVLNAAFSYLQEFRSERIMESFQNMLPSMVVALRDGERTRIPASELVPGDIVLLFEGDRIPADGRLLHDKNLVVDNSSLTGESEPVLLSADASDPKLLESRNTVFSGALVQSGDGLAVVCRTGMRTQIGDIVSLTKDTESVETPIHRELTHFIRIISTIAIVLGVVFFAASAALGKGVIGSLIFAIGIIVANVPEGLLPTVTLALTMASRRMADKNALVRNLESVETLGSTTVICTDKTGTLTENRLSVTSMVVAGRKYGADGALGGESDGAKALEAMALCNNAALTRDGFTGDATEGAMLVYVDRQDAEGQGGLDRFAAFERVEEEPFTSVSRRMIVVCKVPGTGARCAYLKGAPEVVLEMCAEASDEGSSKPMTAELRASIMDDFGELAERGERGLALAWRDLSDGDDAIPTGGFVYAGLVGLIDPPRAAVPDAIARCHSAGIRVSMVTGDYGLTAASIARQIGLFTGDGVVVQGDELAGLDEEGWSELLGHREIVFARLSPQQKLDIVRAYQARGETVTVTGDGVNDAPALKNADMGVAMGVIGTDVAKEASNMVLMDDNFATIVAAIEEGRTIFDNIKKFIAYILTSNVPEILPFIAYALFDMPLALTVVLILAIDLGTDILPALGLGAEKAETDVMSKPPRSRGERLLTRNLLTMSYGIVGMIQAAAGFFTFFVILYSGGWSWGSELPVQDPLYRTAITGFFASIVICQVADVMICRTRRQSILSVGIFSNRLILMGIAVELCLVALISYVPACNVFFGTAPLAPWQLALSLPFAAAILLGDEMRRLFVRRGNPFVLRWLTW